MQKELQGQTPAVEHQHMTAVQESACNENQWHNARLLKTSVKTFFAQHDITKKKFTARIIQEGKSTAAPTYTGLIDNYMREGKTRCNSPFATMTSSAATKECVGSESYLVRRS